MGLGGLWHGASWNFVVWGLWHGMLLSGHRRIQCLPLRPPRVVGVLITFILVTVGWVFFRLRTTGDVLSMLGAMSGLHGVGATLAGLLPFLVVAGVLVWGRPEEWRLELRRWTAPRVVTLAVLTAVAIVFVNDTQSFIYFQF
jgi:alginate O-acetyltransferase complex protein AlgI